MTAATVLMLVAVITVHSTRGSNFADCRLSTKALCHHQFVESLNVFFPNASFNNAVVSLDIFFKSTQNLNAQRFRRHIHFFQIFSDTLAMHECSVLYALFFFPFFSSTAVHICSYILVHVINQENWFFPLSAHTVVCSRGTSMCFPVTSYISSTYGGRHAIVGKLMNQRIHLLLVDERCCLSTMRGCSVILG